MNTTSMTHCLALSGLVLGSVVAAAQPATAAAVPGPIDVSFPVSCPGFDATLSAQGKLGIVDLPGGRQFITGPNLKATVTGPGGSVSYVITGLTKVQNLSDGGQFVTATGANLITVPAANGHPAGLYFTRGTVSWTLNADGSERGGMFTGKGTVADVCAAVA